jgi:hypothetical protein
MIGGGLAVIRLADLSLEVDKVVNLGDFDLNKDLKPIIYNFVGRNCFKLLNTDIF